MSTARAYLAAVWTNGKVYAIGGRDNSSQLNTVEEYDPATDTWRPRAAMPTARMNINGVAATNGKIYVLGGDNQPTQLDEYDPAANTWRTRASMPTSRNSLAMAASRNGRIYAAGGDSGNGRLATVEEYNPATDTWRTRASMPTAKINFGLAEASNGRIYSIGVGSGTAQAVLEEYNPDTDSWRTRTGTPSMFGKVRAVAGSNGKIIALGGPYPYSVAEYDPLADSWTVLGGAPSNLDGYGLTIDGNGRIYYLGGIDGPTPVYAEMKVATFPYEPNDSFDQAAPIAPGFDHLDPIASAADVDYFTFRVSNAPASVTLNLSGLPANYDFFLYAPDRTLLASSARPSTLDESIDATAPVPGDYFVKVAGASGSYSSSPYTLRLSLAEPPPGPTATPTITLTPTVTPVPTATAPPTPTATPTDPYEPNDSYAQAYSLASGAVVYGRLHAAGDVDYFKVLAGVPGLALTASLAGLPANYDLYLDRPDHSPAAASTNLGTNGESISYVVSGSATGYHYLIVVSPAGEYSPATYTLQVSVGASPGTPTTTATSPPAATSTWTATPVPNATATSTRTATPSASSTRVPATATPQPGPAEQRIALHAGWNWLSFAIVPLTTGLAAEPTAYFRDYWGWASLEGAGVPVGTVVEAFSPRGDLVGRSTVNTPGLHGFMRVYGEDPGASPPIPGMRAGETVTFKVNGHPATTAPAAATWESNPTPTQVDLAATPAPSVAAALASIAGRYDYVLGEKGTYAPPPSPSLLNTLVSLEAGKGYFIRMKEPAELVLRGQRLSGSVPLALPAGWHWIGYLPAAARDLPDVLKSIDGKYDYVLGERGTYAPAPAPSVLNSLSRMEPGRGYLIRMREEGSLTYDAGG